MRNFLSLLFTGTAVFLIASCKPICEQCSSSPQVLLSVKTSINDSLGNPCNTCFSYQLYGYNTMGQLISIRDSISPSGSKLVGLPIEFLPYLTSGTFQYYSDITYNAEGNPSKALRDSFAYNTDNRIVKRYRKVQCETCNSYLVNQYTYDLSGQLIADTTYSGQTMNPAQSVLSGYTVFLYSANGDVIKTEQYFAGNNTPVSIRDFIYDSGYSPYKTNKMLLYLATGSPQVLSIHNPLSDGMKYEYSFNGLPLSVRYKGFARTYTYQ